MKQCKTVLVFEYLTYIKSKNFIIISILMLLLALILPTVPTAKSFLDGRGLQPGAASQTGGAMPAVVADSAGVFTPDVLRQYLPSYTFEVCAGAEEAETSVKSGQSKIALIFVEFNYTLLIPNMSLNSYTLGDTIDGMVKEMYLYSRLTPLGVSEETARGFRSFKPESRVLAVNADGGDGDRQRYMSSAAVSYALEFILYFALILYGQYIVISVVREKSTKTMELLITSAKPVWLMIGKVVGVGLAGLTQLTATITLAAVSLAVNGAARKNITGLVEETAFELPPHIIIFLFVFFVLGFFIYAFLYAGFASTASRMEDANSIAAFPMMLVVAAFMVSIFGMSNPGALFVKIISYIPLFTPMVMFMRICLETAALWEAVVGALLCLAAAAGLGVLSAKIYRLGTLMYGKPPKISEIWKMLGE
ncbi:MAG: ABC transporter permease [Clostridiales bacterium]|nr:ABC transporter permease [Clostridiales bacterium]